VYTPFDEKESYDSLQGCSAVPEGTLNNLQPQAKNKAGGCFQHQHACFTGGRRPKKWADRMYRMNRPAC
jgi:hypothetical protein